MPKKFHIGSSGPAECKATIKCRLGGDSGVENHYDSMGEAEKAYEAKMSNDLLSTLKTNSRRKTLKRLAKVGASVAVALVSTSGISNIAAAAEPTELTPSGLSDFMDGFDEVEEGINRLADKANEWLSQDSVKNSDLNKKVEEAVDKAADKANQWLSKSSVRDSRGNQIVEEAISKVPGYDLFSRFLKGEKDSVRATVSDNGDILWQGKSLTPRQDEIEEAKAVLGSMVVMSIEGRGEGYNRNEMFGGNSDATKAKIEQRDILDGVFNQKGRVVSGTLKDPYTGESIEFANGERPHDLEHLVALKEAYRSEDPNNPMNPEQRKAFANDPDNLLLVSSSENRFKSDKNAEDYLPSYEPSQCRFAISTIKVKDNYGLTVSPGEKAALSRVLDTKCEAS